MKYFIGKDEQNEFFIKEVVVAQENETKVDFDYSKLINFLFKNKGIGVTFEFDSHVSEEEKNKIIKTFDLIKEYFVEKID